MKIFFETELKYKNFFFKTKTKPKLKFQNQIKISNPN